MRSDAARLLELLRAQGARLATVESCTAGGLAAEIGSVAGASDALWGGFIVYDNSAKIDLGVAPATLERYGAVSRETARELAALGLSRLPLKKGICLSTTGIAGPSGGTPDKPVGTCWVGIATPQMQKQFLLQEDPSLSRVALQKLFVERALGLALDSLNE